MVAIFIGSLPFQANEAFIRGLFSPFGRVVSVDLHADWANPTHEPYACVDLDVSDPSLAIDALDGQKFGQNHIRVHKRVILSACPSTKSSDFMLTPQTSLSE